MEIPGQARDDDATMFIQEGDKVFALQKPYPPPCFPTLTRHPRESGDLHPFERLFYLIPGGGA